MKIYFKEKLFLYDESGAVTVEWIFLTATLVGLAILILSTIETAVSGATIGTTTKIDTMGSGG